MNYLKYLLEFRKSADYDYVQITYKIVVPDVGDLIKEATLSDTQLEANAVAKGKTTWDEVEICETLGLEIV